MEKAIIFTHNLKKEIYITVEYLRIILYGIIRPFTLSEFYNCRQCVETNYFVKVRIPCLRGPSGSVWSFV